MIHFKGITEENFEEIVAMKRPEGETFVASNAYSLAQAWLFYKDGDVYPFAIYNDSDVVGFMMLDEDLEERCLVVWRIMFPEEHAGKGYGTESLMRVIQLAKESGKYDFMIIQCDPENQRARHVYEKAGFLDTGEREAGEYIMRLDLS